MIILLDLDLMIVQTLRRILKQLLLDNTNAKVIARTKEHPAISFLEENNIAFETCDMILYRKMKISKIRIWYCELYSWKLLGITM